MGEGKYNRNRFKITLIFTCFNIVFVKYLQDFRLTNLLFF
jgi:hypothetical protein